MASAILYPREFRNLSTAWQSDEDTIIVLHTPAVLLWFGDYFLQTIERFALGKRPVIFCDVNEMDQLALLTSARLYYAVLVADSGPLEAPLRGQPLGVQTLLRDSHSRGRLFMLWSEQLTRPKIVEQFARITRHFPGIRVVHYTSANKRRALALPAEMQQVVPFYPLLEHYRQFWETPKIFDVCFIGTVSARRSAINYELANAFEKFEEIRAFGVARDRAVAACRVLVNTHFADDYQVLETIRVAPALASGVLVVSEHCVATNLTRLERHIEFAHQLDIVFETREVLAQYAGRRAALMEFLEMHYEKDTRLTLPFLSPMPVDF